MGTHMSPCGHMAPIAKRRNITRPYHALARRLTLSESSDQQFHRYDYEFIHHEMIRGSFHDHIYIQRIEWDKFTHTGAQRGLVVKTSPLATWLPSHKLNNSLRVLSYPSSTYDTKRETYRTQHT